MKKIGIIICGRYQSCGGGKCFRALRERAGAFAAYPGDEEVEVVGFANCGGCPGGNIETAYGLPAVIGSHPIPLKYLQNHEKLPFWKQTKMEEIAPALLAEDRRVMEDYN